MKRVMIENLVITQCIQTKKEQVNILTDDSAGFSSGQSDCPSAIAIQLRRFKLLEDQEIG